MSAAPASALVLAVFDLDGTITRHDTLQPLLWGHLLRNPWRAPRLLLALPALLCYLSGNGDRGSLKGALIHAVLGGLHRVQIENIARRHVERVLHDGLYFEALELIEWHRRQGHHLVLMSASPDLYVPKIAARLGFKESLCSTVRWRADDTLDGRLAGENVRGMVKARLFKALCTRHLGAPSYAYGNSSADLLHMRLADHGLYINGPANASGLGGKISCVRWSHHGRVTSA